jgi:hypothetical protein
MQEPFATGTEPELTTEPALLPILAELSAREPLFHRPEFGTGKDDFMAMTAEDFWEVGASGRRYSRAYVLDELERRHSRPHDDIWETKDFHCRRLSADVCLLTYTLLQGNMRLTRRTTIWQHNPDGWKAIFHQGTVVQDAG